MELANLIPIVFVLASANRSEGSTPDEYAQYGKRMWATVQCSQYALFLEIDLEHKLLESQRVLCDHNTLSQCPVFEGGEQSMVLSPRILCLS